MRKPINGELIYTGGGIFIQIGATDDGNWYIADHSMDAVRIINSDPNKAPNNGDDAWYPEWQETHLVEDYEDENKETILFLHECLKLNNDYDSKRLDSYLHKSYPQYFDGYVIPKEIVSNYLDNNGCYYIIADQWKTRDGDYFLIKEDPTYSTVYVLRIYNGKIYNVDNDVCN